MFFDLFDVLLLNNHVKTEYCLPLPKPHFNGRLPTGFKVLFLFFFLKTKNILLLKAAVIVIVVKVVSGGNVMNIFV